jgi:CRP/FNR family transcriptional regulator, transcriptional activator FtrB
MADIATTARDTQPMDGADGSLLRRAPVFADLTEPLLKRLAPVSTLTRLPSRAELFREGAEAASLHILLEGYVTLSARAADGRRVVTELIQPVRHIALATVLAKLPYAVAAETVSPSVLIAMPSRALHEIMRDSPELAAALMRAQALDYAALVRDVCDLKLRTAAERLVDYLLELVADQNADTLHLHLPVGKHILAAHLGCRQENLSRAFAILRHLGVETHGRRVILHDVRALRNFTLPGSLPRSAPA